MIRRYLSYRTPHRECISIVELSIEDLTGSYLLIDVDNTLCMRRSDEIDPVVLQFLLELKAKQIVKGICLVSNVVTRAQHRVDRVARIADRLDCPYVCAHWPRVKPNPTPYQEALAKLGATTGEAIMIGDQLLTDILGANKLGMRTVLVRPLGKDNVITRPRRAWERQVVRLRHLFKVTSPPRI